MKTNSTLGEQFFFSKYGSIHQTQLLFVH